MAELVKILSPLETVFHDSENHFDSFTSFSMLKNEKKSFQLLFTAEKNEKVTFSVASPLSEFIHFSAVRQVNAGLTRFKTADDFYLPGDRHSFPDLLVPMEDASFTAESGGFSSVWVHIYGELPAGSFTCAFSCSGSEPLSVTVEVIDAELPEQKLIYTNWFHTDCLMSYYGFGAFSDAYWRAAEKFLRRAVQYGMNCVLTPLFTPPLDTQVGGERPTVQLVDVFIDDKNEYSFSFDKLDRWIDMCEKCGIRYFEMSHLFTQWGARHAPKIIARKNGKDKKIFGWRTKASGKKYAAFLGSFAASLKEYINKKGIKDRCIFHVSDEPQKRHLRVYKKAAQIVYAHFGEFPIIDALSEYSFYEKGIVRIPVPNVNSIEPFIGNADPLWTYYCSGQGDKYASNRFFAMPAQRTRIIGLQLYKFDVKGFLHWGYNFYYTRFSKRLADPYKETDAGHAFPSGDSFVVYPGKDFEPLDSPRLYTFYDGIQDMLALELLQSLAGREKALAVLEQGLEKELSFNEYPHSAGWLLETRERINAEIKKSL